VCVDNAVMIILIGNRIEGRNRGSVCYTSSAALALKFVPLFGICTVDSIDSYQTVLHSILII
jgi:hypothetical protein